MFAPPQARAVDLHWSSPLLGGVAALALGLLLGATAVLASPMVAVAGLTGGALCLAVLRRPLIGLHALVALAFLLPFAVVPVRLGAQLTGLEAILGLTLGVTLLRGLARRERFTPDGPTWLLVAILGLATLSFLLSLAYTGSVADTGRRVTRLFAAMLVFPLALRLVRNRQHIEGLLLILMLCAGLEAATAVALQFAPREVTVGLLSSLAPIGYPDGPSVLRFLPGENDTYTDIARATGTAVDPNVLGGELMLGAALVLAQLFSPRPLLPRWLLLTSGAVIVLAMLLSHSRSSWVGLVSALLVLATLRYRRLWLAAVPACLAIALLPTGRVLLARVLSGFTGQDKAAGMRLDEYRNALEIIQQYPLFGIGFGGAPTVDLAPGVSSIYLTVAETMGLPALALFLAVLTSLLLPALKRMLAPLDARQQGSLAGLLTVLVSALVAGLFDHYFSSPVFPHMVALFWLCCALLRRATLEPRAASATTG